MARRSVRYRRTIVAVAGPFLVVSIVLVVSGMAKLAQPGRAGDLVAAVARRSVPAWTGRVVGAVEVAVGAAALSGWRWAAVAVAAAYLVFAAAAQLARRLGVPSCGCFGASPAPPGRGHVVLNLASAVVGALAASGAGDRSLGIVFDHGAVRAIGLASATAAAVCLVIAVETVAAEVAASRALLVDVVRDPEPRRR